MAGHTRQTWLPALGPKPGISHWPFLSPTRCSTVCTLSVRSSRANRRRTAVRSLGQGTSAPPVSSSTLVPRGHPAPAHSRPVRAPTPVHPTNRTNKAGRGCHGTWVGLDGVVSSPVPGRNRPDYKAHPNQVFPSRDRRVPVVSPLLRLSPGGGSGCCDSLSPPSIPTSNLTQVPALKESINRPKLE